jgi:hypothetical protein
MPTRHLNSLLSDLADLVSDLVGFLGNLAEEAK